MANCSSAYGTITLGGVWTDEMLARLNTIKSEWASWTYNIETDSEFSADCTSQTFFGCGRWAFHNNIKALGEWTHGECESKPELGTAYALLTSEMQKHESYIDLFYSDDESGSLWLCDGTARLRAEGGALIVEHLSEQECEYCWKEYLERGCCDSSILGELVDEILDVLELDAEDREAFYDMICQWVTDHTAPNDRADQLSIEQWSALEALVF